MLWMLKECKAVSTFKNSHSICRDKNALVKTKYTRQLRIQDQNGLSNAKGCVTGRLLWGAECLLRSALGISMDGREVSELDWAEGEVKLGSRPRDSLGSHHGRSGTRKALRRCLGWSQA